MSFVDVPTLDSPVGSRVPAGARMKAYCTVTVDGVPVTDRLNPFLTGVLIHDGVPFPSCEVKLDDRDGRLDIPHSGSSLNIDLGWDDEELITVFQGMINDVEHVFDRQDGRRMTVRAYTVELTTMIKAPASNSVGVGAPPGTTNGTQIPFSAAATAFSGGIPVKIHSSLAGITRDYWAQNNESFMHWAQRMKSELGCIWRFEGGAAVFTVMGKGADGSEKPTITAVWGMNIISWALRPYLARSAWKSSNQFYYDHLLSQWKFANAAAAANPLSPSAIYALPAPAPNSSVANQQAAGASLQGYSNPGGGRIVINGEPAAQHNGFVEVIGARPGIDGVWRIESAEHSWSRDQGYITKLEVTPMSADPTTLNNMLVAYGTPPQTPPPSTAPSTPWPSGDVNTGESAESAQTEEESNAVLDRLMQQLNQ